MKLHVVVEIVDGNEGCPTISIHTTNKGALKRVRELRKENKELGLDADEFIIVSTTVEVEK